MKSVQIGVIRGVFYSPEFSKLNPEKLTLVSETEQLVGMLEMARIDIAMSSVSHRLELFEGHFKKVTLEDKFSNTHYISIPKNSPAIRFYDDIARVMLKYRKSGKINQYFEKYGMKAPQQIFAKEEFE